MAVASPSGGRCREVYTRVNVWTLCRQDQKMAVVEMCPLLEVRLYVHVRFFFSVCRKWTKIWIISALVSKQRTVIKKEAVPDKNEIQ